MAPPASSSLGLRQWRLLLLLAVGNLLVLNVLCSNEIITPYATRPVSSATSSSRPLFGIRGGGFFGFGSNRSSNKSHGDGDGGGGDGGDGGPPKRYPALSREEIEEKLNIPVFGLTDANGNGVVLTDGGSGDNVFHFFFSRHMADSALEAVTAANAGAPALKVSAFHLGKCWFKLITNDSGEKYTLKKYGKDVVERGMGGGEVTRPVTFRLVPNMKDLMGARILTGLKPGDVERLKHAVDEQDPPTALSIIQNAANSEDSSFNHPFDEIPVFAIAQMRVRRRDEHGMPSGENMMPFHLSTKTMSDTWNQFVKHSPQFEDAEATLQLVELHKMIDLMQQESDFDFRNIVFVHPDYDRDEQRNNDYTEDSDDDEDDDGGGGDNGMMADGGYDEGSIEPFVSMEIFADGSASGQELVQL